MNPEPQHNEAIREEIGYRLSMLLSREQAGAPERLLQLVRQLRKMDQELADQDVVGPKASIERTDVWLRAILLEQKQNLQERLEYEPSQSKRDEFERLLASIDDTLSREFGMRPPT